MHLRALALGVCENTGCYFSKQQGQIPTHQGVGFYLFILSTVHKDVKKYYFNEKRDNKVEKKDRWKRRERNQNFYIICWYSLYYFNRLYVKIKTEMLGEL